MPNRVHFIAVPNTKEGLARAIDEAHRRYTRRMKLIFSIAKTIRASFMER